MRLRPRFRHLPAICQSLKAWTVDFAQKHVACMPSLAPVGSHLLPQYHTSFLGSSRIPRSHLAVHRPHGNTLLSTYLRLTTGLLVPLRRRGEARAACTSDLSLPASLSQLPALERGCRSPQNPNPTRVPHAFPYFPDLMA